ncbi:hypothetical protein NDU88_002152 [Pleurodeles waltl]|uniref:Uncharacterized protein n=1 Tax=Pleurodeles waltl TaxID=8319 RepID=A0AAV7WKF2_PLEWA|nr:hypothetical protein NDU88_002152 [Pleurodeles waltl]
MAPLLLGHRDDPRSLWDSDPTALLTDGDKHWAVLEQAVVDAEWYLKRPTEIGDTTAGSRPSGEAKSSVGCSARPQVLLEGQEVHANAVAVVARSYMCQMACWDEL